eukprot:UN28295
MEGESVHGVTKFSDLSQQEFKDLYLTYKPQGPRNFTVKAPTVATLPDSYDWRDHGKVTAVKDQERCGSCWAFSTVEEIESQWAMAGNPLTKFSVQQVVSCDKNDGGCRGGDTITAYRYVESAGGLASEADYRYTSGKGRNGKCKKNVKIAGGNIKSMEW